MWDTIVDSSEGDRREKQLMTHNDYWKELIDAGASVHRHNEGKQSAIRIIEHLLPKPQIVLLFQQEMRQYQRISDTSAGDFVRHFLEDMARRQQEMVDLLHQQIAGLETEKEEMRQREDNLIKTIEKLTSDVKRLTMKVESLEETKERAAKRVGIGALITGILGFGE